MLVHNICRSTGRFRGGRAVDFFWPARSGGCRTAVVFLCDLIFLPKQDALCGLESVRARSVFPYRFGYFLLFLLLLLQIQNRKALRQGIDCLARLHWRDRFPRLNFADVFGNDRAARTHH
jgi:hypothetical protein